jgi:hypothetical protein
VQTTKVTRNALPAIGVIIAFHIQRLPRRDACSDAPPVYPSPPAPRDIAVPPSSFVDNCLIHLDLRRRARRADRLAASGGGTRFWNECRRNASV